MVCTRAWPVIVSSCSPNTISVTCACPGRRGRRAVTAACMLTPRALFLEIGGLDEENFRVAYNDVDYCYRLIDLGYSCIQCGSAELFQYEGRSRGFGDNPAEERAMRLNILGAWTHTQSQSYLGAMNNSASRGPMSRAHREAGSYAVRHPQLQLRSAPSSLFELASGLMAQGRADPIVISPSDGPLRQPYAVRIFPPRSSSTPCSDGRRRRR